MQTKTWILMIAAILLVCLAFSIFIFLPKEAAAYAEVYSQGKLVHTLDLRIDRQVTVSTDLGTNVISVKDGAVAVTQADCPDGYCMDRGYCNSGVQIVCLPHQLVIQFVGEPAVDGAA